MAVKVCVGNVNRKVKEMRGGVGNVVRNFSSMKACLDNVTRELLTPQQTTFSFSAADYGLSVEQWVSSGSYHLHLVGNKTEDWYTELELLPSRDITGVLSFNVQAGAVAPAGAKISGASLFDTHFNEWEMYYGGEATLSAPPQTYNANSGGSLMISGTAGQVDISLIISSVMLDGQQIEIV